MTTESKLDKIIDILQSAVDDRKNLTDVFVKLLEQSENRIDATNKMVQSLATVCKENQQYLTTITRVYTEQFENMAVSRKNCQYINKGLIEALNSTHELLREANRKIDELSR